MDEKICALSWDFNHSTAQLTMNRHFYGAAHGPSLNWAARLSCWSYFGVSDTYSWQLRIIHDKLRAHGAIMLRRCKGGTGKNH